MLPFVVCFVLYTYFFDIKPVNALAYIRRNLALLLIQAVSFVLMLRVFYEVTRPDKPLFGAEPSPYAVLAGYAELLAPDASWQRWLALVLGGVLLIGVALLRRQILLKPALCTLLLYFVGILIVARLMHRVGPSERELLPLWPVFVVALLEIWDYCETKSSRFAKLATSSALVLTLFLAGNFVASIRFDATNAWAQDYAVRGIMYEAAMKNRSLGSADLPRAPARFYQKKIAEEYGVVVDLVGR